jgi:RNA polymerase sigma factor (sigma-70 family)
VSTTTPLSDEDLVTKVFRQHDPAAFAILYDRYFPQVFDQAYRVLRDTDRAADVAQDTFTKLLEVKEQHYPRTSFRAWLYTISRNRALDETRRAKRTQPLATVTTGDEPERVVEPASDEPGPERTVLDREVADLVWEAARGLRPEDYTLLDLSVRKGLSIEELAQVLHTSRGNVSTRLSRLRDAQEEAITALLLARRGRNQCAILATLLPADSNSPLTPALRRQIIRHLESCATCQGVRKRYVSAVELLSGLAPILPPALLQDQLRAQLLGRLAAPAPTAANGHI